jgi:hypothetical protein
MRHFVYGKRFLGKARYLILNTIKAFTQVTCNDDIRKVVCTQFSACLGRCCIFPSDVQWLWCLHVKRWFLPNFSSIAHFANAHPINPPWLNTKRYLKTNSVNPQFIQITILKKGGFTSQLLLCWSRKVTPTIDLEQVSLISMTCLAVKCYVNITRTRNMKITLHFCAEN